MILKKDFSVFLEKYFQIHDFEDYCVNGLQVSGKSKIQKMAFGVSASRNFLENAQKCGADAVFVHHGLFWGSGIRAIDDNMQKRLFPLISHNISLFAVHLPLDAHAECGNNYEIARAFSLVDIEKHDIGTAGNLKNPLSFGDFSEKCTEIFGQIPRFAEDFLQKPIERIGICSGGGGDWMDKCGKIDAFVTGEFEEKYWHLARERGIALFAVGHFASERFGVRAFQKQINQRFPQLETFFFDESCPV